MDGIRLLAVLMGHFGSVAASETVIYQTVPRRGRYAVTVFEQDRERMQARQQQLIQFFWADPTFARQFCSDPKSAIYAHLGIEIPDHIEIHVHCNNATTLHLIIPPKPMEFERDVSFESLSGFVFTGALQCWGNTLLSAFIGCQAC